MDNWFQQGQESQMSALKQILALEQQERAQRSQDFLEAQREETNQLSARRADMQAARDSQRDLYQAQILENQEQAATERELNHRLELQRNWTNDYYRMIDNYQKRYDRLGFEQDKILARLEGANPALQARLAQINDWVSGELIKRVSTMGNTKDIASVVNAIRPAKGSAPVNLETIKGVMGPTWEQLQKEGRTDAESIVAALTPVFKQTLQTWGYNPDLRQVKERYNQYDLERKALMEALNGTGKNRLPTLEEYIKMIGGPLAAPNGDTSPLKTSAKQHLASGMVMIGNLPNSKPIHIQPTSFGGTITNDKGQIQIVPSSNATFSDLAAIEMLNKSGGKILAEPMLEEETDKPAVANDPIPGRVTAPVSNIKQSNENVEVEKLNQLSDQLKSEIGEQAKAIARAVQQTKLNPVKGLSYDQVLAYILDQSNQLAQKYHAISSPDMPQKIYALLINNLSGMGFGTLQPDEDQSKTLQRLNINYNTFRKDTQRDYGDDPKMLARLQREAPSPWLYGKWTLPSADQIGYNYLNNWYQWRQNPEVAGKL